MRKELMTIRYHQEIAHNIYELEVEGTLVQDMNSPGQFVHIKVGEGEPLLRRPISIASINHHDEAFTMIYRKEGKGTTLLSTKKPGDTLDVLGPLGHGFPVHLEKGQKALLIGGGIGVPPLYELSKQLVSKGVEVTHVLGFQTSSVAFYLKEFSLLGTTHIATVDGTLGSKGFVTDCLREKNIDYDEYYSCGPKVMLKALEETLTTANGYISLEERMGCGIGACFACVCHRQSDPTGNAYVKVCSDGPVFKAGEVVL
ncbi:dihydroorotate dehydrogenase [Bacillus coahuilensis m2-6]|uniref:dihydroorotate dehydrogenase electron transfer subunit n=1 Tax=Bacillus coahuilensis TaxID=408580 RepID=UPI000750389A|nr:dihydroorotate dehydrogenase electron transfer subunit [Bacillus coahuilensis]KUP08601.1 dihydroorotate dehydrogenase [Bacillus coahuilensis m2-6]